MSEYQNRAVRIQRESFPLEAHEMKRQMLSAALQLFNSLGGSQEDAVALVRSLPSLRNHVGHEVGVVMFELARISHANDIDIMQAAYNVLDAAVADGGWHAQ